MTCLFHPDQQDCNCGKAPQKRRTRIIRAPAANQSEPEEKPEIPNGEDLLNAKVLAPILDPSYKKEYPLMDMEFTLEELEILAKRAADAQILDLIERG